ncbi:hypothetical protein J3R30DRAFT_2699246 [Lentinula aciculospora]|uniref:Uncharacterized protein n=1 Tax=Lentinula aciculospora TaxID=153920 RepID=A0A9W9ACH5_9AGAR|nr:hypothetical protein J3R30DRAFT_2699246 [Lentinula aciculospora]
MVFSFVAKMLTTATILYSALSACTAPNPRQVRNGHGTLSAPSSGSIVSQGSSFPFEFQDSNWCEDGYSAITVWLTNYAPTTSSLNSTGQFPEGEYSWYYGEYLIPNFGLPVLSGSTPPPSSLVLPESLNLSPGDEAYLAVVETGTNCPPGLNIPPQYELTDLVMTVG